MSGEIVVGIDRSAPSLAAVRWSIERAIATEMSLRVVNVLEPQRHDSSLEDAELSAWSLVDDEVSFARKIGEELSVTGAVLEGDPATELSAASQNADLVVVGTHKTGFIQGSMYGSRFLRLVAEAPFACAFVPEPSGRRRRGVVVQLDDSDAGREVIRFGAREAARLGEELILVGSRTGVRVAAGHDHHWDASLLAGIAIAREVDPDITIRGRNTNMPAAEALVHAATTATVLIVGCSTKAESRLPIAGAIALDVLLNLSSPVIVVRACRSVAAAAGGRAAASLPA